MAKKRRLRTRWSLDKPMDTIIVSQIGNRAIDPPHTHTTQLVAYSAPHADSTACHVQRDRTLYTVFVTECPVHSVHIVRCNVQSAEHEVLRVRSMQRVSLAMC